VAVVQRPGRSIHWKRGDLYRANKLNDEWPGTETEEVSW